MIQAIINLLENDSELSTLLDISPFEPKIYPLEHSDETHDPYICYNYSPVKGDYIIQNRVELRIVSNSLMTVQQIEKVILRLLNWKRQHGFVHEGTIVYFSSLNGGGLLKNPDTGMYEQFLFFNVRTN